MVYSISEMNEVVPVSRFRSILAQVTASLAQNLLLLGLGMAISFATICVPAVLNAPEGLSMNDNQASWFGSLSFLTQPLGALISGPIVDYFGRRKATFLVNLPHIIAWILLYYSSNLPMLFFGNALLGIGTGIMEAPINSYVGEISEPSIRSGLCTLTQVFLSIGTTGMYLLGSVVHWRIACLLSLSIPLLSMVLVAIGAVPDTPVWLLSVKREKEALKSLCYLRGWTKPENVKEEFDKLVIYAKSLHCCVLCLTEGKLGPEGKEETVCEHVKMNFIVRALKRFNLVMLCKETLRPLSLTMLYFAFVAMAGLVPVKPNMENVCAAFGMDDEPKTIVVMVGVISIAAAIIIIACIKTLGKRKLGISAMLGTAICCTALSVYAKENLPENVFSYNPTTFPKEKSMVPLVLFYLLTAFTGFNVSWVILGEVFPFRSRASAQGTSAAFNYIVMFIGAKTLIDLETHFRLAGTFAIYAIFAYIGTIYLYLFLPETEGVPLQEIELNYQGKLRIFADDWFANIFKRLKKKK